MVYTWQDGDRTRRLILQSGLVVQPSTKNTPADVVEAVIGGTSIVRRHIMYVDKPMRAHGLMQAIARVNRVFGDKPGGRVVEYLGLAHELKRALETYTESGGTGCTAIERLEAVGVMQEKTRSAAACSTAWTGPR